MTPADVFLMAIPTGIPNVHRLLQEHDPADIAATFANWMDALGEQLIQVGEKLDDARWIMCGTSARDVGTALRKLNR